MAENKEKKSFYKTNLKYILDNGFKLNCIYDEIDEFGSKIEIYSFDYDLFVPTKKLFYVDLQNSEKFKELMESKRGK